jgi:ketosteroid isomerase-like protein
MKSPVLLGLLVMIFGTVGCGRPGNPDPVSEIRAVMSSQVDAWNRGDVEGFLSGYLDSPDLIFASRGTFSRGWRALMDRYKQAYPEGSMGTLRFNGIEIYPIGRNAAWVVGTWRLDMEDGSPHGAFTLIMKRTSDGWKIIHDHSSGVEDSHD